MEREADRVGHGVLTGAGYEGAAFVRMFERLQQAARLNDDGSFPYLRSHPLTTERMADMKARQPLAEARGGGVSSPQAGAAAQAWHALMAARARVLAEQDVPRLRAWVEQAQRLPVRVGEHAVRYAGALSALRLKEPLAALVLAQGLVDEAPPGAESRRAVLHLMLEIGLSPGGMQGATVGAPGAAQQALRTLWPDMARQALGAPDRASVLLGAQAALALGEAAAVSQRLQVWLVGRPSDATGWELLAQAWQAQHHPLRALRAQAEARVAVHDTAGAVDRLRAAQDLARAQPDLDPIEQAIIDARQRELQQRLRELAQEKGV
jgi:predicted Zn-dependent protease